MKSVEKKKSVLKKPQGEFALWTNGRSLTDTPTKAKPSVIPGVIWLK